MACSTTFKARNAFHSEAEALFLYEHYCGHVQSHKKFRIQHVLSAARGTINGLARPADDKSM